jgi:putative membrane protein
MSYSYLKALHIIFVVTWFSGLFYIVRLFIYHTEAENKKPQEKEILQSQFKIMEKRLWYGITWPSAILTLIFGSSLIRYHLPLAGNPWLIIKLFFVSLLFLYHLQCGRIFQDLQNNKILHSSKNLRIWNEIATLFLVAIVFLVVLKSALSMVYGLVGLVIFSALLMLAIRIYRKTRIPSDPL